MIGTYNKLESWEKCSVFNLDNGWEAAVQYGYYGEYVTRLTKDGKSWHASDGFDNPYGNSSDPVIRRIFKDHIAIPDFARDWAECVIADVYLIRPRFEKKV